MISKINEEYKLDYYRLGTKLNSNFSYLFNLEETLNKEYNLIYGYIENDKLLGFIHITTSFDEADIINIVVDDYYRKKGVGKKLIEYVIKRFNLKAINLEVRQSNDAINFYKKMGFKIIRTIANYYHNEDAYFMKKVIK